VQLIRQQVPQFLEEGSDLICRQAPPPSGMARGGLAPLTQPLFDESLAVLRSKLQFQATRRLFGKRQVPIRHLALIRPPVPAEERGFRGAEFPLRFRGSKTWARSRPGRTHGFRWLTASTCTRPCGRLRKSRAADATRSASACGRCGTMPSQRDAGANCCCGISETNSADPAGFCDNCDVSEGKASAESEGIRREVV
jgi:hypothetical protein